MDLMFMIVSFVIGGLFGMLVIALVVMSRDIEDR